MSPRTGRPPKGNPKAIKLTLRISDDTAQRLKRCADALNLSRTEVIEQGIDLVEQKIKK